jgi:iron complex outermembrane receptor protein
MGHRLHPLSTAVAVACAMTATWHHAGAESATELSEIVVSAETPGSFPSSSVVTGPALEIARVGTSDTAKLLLQVPGVSLYGAGGVSSLPAIHGLADDRVRVKVDGMDLIASCPNHMNPPLSYLDPTAVGSLKVYAGIVPVSQAGDSIGGTIIADSPEPEFAGPDQKYLLKGTAGGYYQSNGNGYSANIGASAATDSLSIAYSGALAKSQNYKAGGDFKTTGATGRLGHTLPLNEVGSTAYDTRNQTLDFAWKSGIHKIEAEIGYQDIPQELFPNQRMDMLGNEQTSFNLNYTGEFGWGDLEAQAYYQYVDHFMDFGPDKRFWYGPASGRTTVDGKPCWPISNTCAAGMPMNTEAKTLGASLQADIDLTDTQLLRLGAEYQGYRLDDWWSPSGANMYPGTFWNINDGRRDRVALYGEWEARPTPQWLTLLGIRFEQVDMDTGDVRGYNTTPTAPGNQYLEANRFNAQERQETDNNVNLTALARYRLDETKSLEFGYAHLVRSPNLYERYTWSSWTMAASMNNSVGDGNGYVGDINLKPEQANTLSATFDWHAPERDWEIQATPYYTYVTDYVDAIRTAVWIPDAFNVLQYANQKAQLYGIDISGKMPLFKNDFGRFGLKGLLNYTKGENLDTNDGLYNIMPLNVALSLTQQLGGWDNGIEVVMVDAKDDLSEIRNEIETPGYTLFNLRGSYSWTKVRLDFGIENLLDRFYSLPLGGAYLGQGKTMELNPPTPAWGTAVPGMGRSFYVGMNIKF